MPAQSKDNLFAMHDSCFAFRILCDGLRLKGFILLIFICTLAFVPSLEAEEIEIDLADSQYGVDIPEGTQELRLINGDFVLTLEQKQVLRDRLCLVQEVKSVGVQQLRYEEHPVNVFRPMLMLNFNTHEEFVEYVRASKRQEGRKGTDAKIARKKKIFANIYADTTPIDILTEDEEAKEKVRQIRVGDVIRLSGEMFRYTGSWVEGRKDPPRRDMVRANYFYLRDIEVVSSMDGAQGQAAADEGPQAEAANRKADVLAMHPAVLALALFLMGGAVFFYFKS